MNFNTLHATPRNAANTVNPSMIKSEVSRAQNGSSNGACLTVRRVCDRGEIRRVFSLATGRLVLRITQGNLPTFSIYENAEDVGV